MSYLALLPSLALAAILWYVNYRRKTALAERDTARREAGAYRGIAKVRYAKNKRLEAALEARQDKERDKDHEEADAARSDSGAAGEFLRDSGGHPGSD